MNSVIIEYIRTNERTVNVILICEYTEAGRMEAMARTLDDIRALPRTAHKETP